MAVMAAWYSLLLAVLGHDTDPFRPALLGTAFNSMLEHLLAGRFDIDPDAIGPEAFLISDRTVAYFGIFCALLRLPLVPFGALSNTDITAVSCLLAVCLGGWFQLRAVLLIRRLAEPGPRRTWLCGALIVCILFGGQQIQFLRPSIYQEPIDWAGALAMIFVFLAIRGVVTSRGFDLRTLVLMAICAGLGLLARVTFGVGMYVVLGGLFLVELRYPRRWLPAASVLTAFLLIAGVVNQGRWGSPFVFADFTRYAMALDLMPERLERLATYGAFNLQRIWLGLGFYFFPIWALGRPDGHLLFAEAQARLLDAVELPPGSFLLSDPLLLGLSIVGLTSIRQARVAVVAAGLAVPPILMLCAISMSWRYRMEFFPFFLFTALLGVRHLCRTASLRPGVRPLLVAIVVLSVTASHAMAALYAVSPWGQAEAYIARDGWVGTYVPRLRAGHD